MQFMAAREKSGGRNARIGHEEKPPTDHEEVTSLQLTIQGISIFGCRKKTSSRMWKLDAAKCAFSANDVLWE